MLISIIIFRNQATKQRNL